MVAILGAAALVALVAIGYWALFVGRTRIVYIQRPPHSAKCSCDHARRDHANGDGRCMQLMPRKPQGWQSCGCEAYQP